MSEELKEVIEEQPKKKRGRPKKVVEVEEVKSKETTVEPAEKVDDTKLQQVFDYNKWRLQQERIYQYRSFAHYVCSYSGSKKLAKRNRKISKQFA